PLGGINLVIVLESEMTKSHSDRFQAGAFRLMPKRVVGVRSIDDFAKQFQSGIIVKSKLFKNRLKRTLFIVMAEFDITHIKRNGIEPSCLTLHHFCRHEIEIGVRINEFPYQPGACNTIDLYVLSRNPSHDLPPLLQQTNTNRL